MRDVKSEIKEKLRKEYWNNFHGFIPGSSTSFNQEDHFLEHLWLLPLHYFKVAITKKMAFLGSASKQYLKKMNLLY